MHNVKRMGEKGGGRREGGIEKKNASGMKKSFPVD